MRVLIFTADIGEGHDLPARALRDALLRRRPDADIEVLDALDTAGPGARFMVREGAEFLLERVPWLFDVQFWLVARFPPTRVLARHLAAALSRKGLLRTIAARRPDILVSTYPAATEVLAELRHTGRIGVPLVSAITDLAALRYWAHPGCDLHLLIHPESAQEVRDVAGARARVETVRGLTSAAFDAEVDQAAARAALDLPATGAVVVVSGGGWGVGDLRGAVEAALRAPGDVCVVVLCGRNERVQRTLGAAFAGDGRVRVMGFTDRMSEVLAAGDVLVHSTAGLTVFEALVRGMRVISYGWGVGHIRLNNQAYRRFGLADVVAKPRDLTAAVARALASPRRPDVGYGRRPAAADAILALAGGLEAGDGARAAQDGAAG